MFNPLLCTSFLIIQPCYGDSGVLHHLHGGAKLINRVGRRLADAWNLIGLATSLDHAVAKTTWHIVA